MLRAARAGDEAGIEAFLKAHADTTMFLRANLARFGLFNREHPHAMTYHLDDRGGICGVFARSNAGFVMAQGSPERSGFWAALRREMAGQRVAGFAGGLDMTRLVREALGLQDATFSLDRPEPLYRLSLGALRDPGAGKLRATVPGDADLLTRWFRAYHVEALGAADDDALTGTIKTRVENTLRDGNAGLLEVDDRPVSTTAFNARLPDMVQIGGVYTPPDLRGRGYARVAVAEHLKQARADGVRTAILFASGEPACRAYEALGFEKVGQYALAILKDPVLIAGAT